MKTQNKNLDFSKNSVTDGGGSSLFCSGTVCLVILTLIRD